MASSRAMFSAPRRWGSAVTRTSTPRPTPDFNLHSLVSVQALQLRDVGRADAGHHVVAGHDGPAVVAAHDVVDRGRAAERVEARAGVAQARAALLLVELRED